MNGYDGDDESNDDVKSYPVGSLSKYNVINNNTQKVVMKTCQVYNGTQYKMTNTNGFTYAWLHSSDIHDICEAWRIQMNDINDTHHHNVEDYETTCEDIERYAMQMHDTLSDALVKLLVLGASRQ